MSEAKKNYTSAYSLLFSKAKAKSIDTMGHFVMK